MQYPLAVRIVAVAASVFVRKRPRPLRAFAEPQAGVSLLRGRPLDYSDFSEDESQGTG